MYSHCGLSEVCMRAYEFTRINHTIDDFDPMKVLARLYRYMSQLRQALNSAAA